MKLFIKVTYIGKDFYGYQAQKDKRTVQSELNRAACELFGFDCDITGCSRTDSGVHANCFCATVNKRGECGLETEIDINKIPRAMSAHLPEDISVFDAEWVDDEFHARYDVKFKEYIYRIHNDPIRDPFKEGREWHYPRVLDDYAIERMNVAAGNFIGTHDFSAFMAQGSNVATTVRTVVSASVVKEVKTIIFRVAADGFLYNMVRIMTGTLISVGEGKISPEDIKKIIESCDRSLAGMTAPAHGLYLNKVTY
jgi:tRNA pseudouridine38-40 synthase